MKSPSASSIRRAGLVFVAAALALTLVPGPASATPLTSSGTHDAVTQGRAIEASSAAAPRRCPARAPRAHKITTRLHTCGRTIRNFEGRRVRLLGLEINAYGNGAGEDADHVFPPGCDTWTNPPAFADEDIRKWGFNSVVLMVSWANLEARAPRVNAAGKVTKHFWNLEYVDALKSNVAAFRRNNVAVVLMMLQSRWSPAFTNLVLPNGSVQACGSGMPKWLYPNGGGIRKMVKAERAFFHNRNPQSTKYSKPRTMFMQALRFVTVQFKESKGVVGIMPLWEAYDLLAQPYPGTENIKPEGLDIATFFETATKVVRSVDPKLLILFGDHYNLRKKRWALTRRPRIPNGVVAPEFYSIDWAGHGKERIARYYRRSVRWNYPLWVSEWSLFNRTMPRYEEPRTWARDSRIMGEWTSQRGIGWAICCYFWDNFQRNAQPDAPGFYAKKWLRKPKPHVLDVLLDAGLCPRCLR